MRKQTRLPVLPEGGGRPLRFETPERAALQEALGVIRREYDAQSGALIGFRIVGVEMRRVDSDLRSMPSSSAISGPKPKVYRGAPTSEPDCDASEAYCAEETFVGRAGVRLGSEMEVNALGKSRTYKMSEERRLARIVAGLPPEDRVERVQAKVRVYLNLGPARGDILRVWPR